MTKINFYPYLILVLIIGVLFLVVKNDPKSPPNLAKETLQITPTVNMSSLKIEDTLVGSGPAVKSGDTIAIHYLGTLVDGKKFDSSYDRGQPFQTKIGVGQVIKGWDEGVVGMKVGGKRKLTIPPELGYGSQEIPGAIPANSTLIFEVELVKIL
ncbi:FKBP-type peptidyl-prolyl cis-trans isomerase [Candidatus Shapirobacteria bacterium]|nr:FKBP-type peptidyl-prolyl cis-trans isomerase [Candidatus Shapirobacteria bacterium]